MKPEIESSELPDDVVREMRRLDRSLAVLAPAVDRQVAAAAAAHFSNRPERAGPAMRRRAISGALAASLVIGVFVVRMQTGVEPERPAADLDGSGVVDILDAFALARANRAAPAESQAEIDALIREIVALNGSGS